MAEEPLYQDSQLRIDYHPSSHEDHILYLKEDSMNSLVSGSNPEDEFSFVLERGFLQDMARLPRGELEQMIDRIHPTLRVHLARGGVGVDGLHVAICQAYHEQEERMQHELQTLKF
jgi:hypothetical protein